MIKKVCLIILSLTFVCTRNPFPDKTTDDFQTQCLKTHNYYRALHNTDPLQVDQKIVNYAKSRCTSISRYDSLSAGHSGLELGTYGENLYWGASTDGRLVGANDAIKSWYDEIRYYSYSNPTFSSRTGHFTQLIWKSTTRVGCATCGGKDGQWYETYVVCNYQPAGNMMGKFAQNVMRPSNGQNSSPAVNDPNETPIEVPDEESGDGIAADTSQHYSICRCSKPMDSNSGQQLQCIPVS